MGEDGGRYLTVAGEMMWSDISKILKKEFPERKWPFRQLSYYFALIVCAFHPRVSVSWAKRHLKNKLYWDATPAEKDLKMEWKSCLLYTSPSPRDLSTSRMPSSA